jgi:hypothetical protein
LFNTPLLTRIALAGLPVLVIALIAGAAGYFSKDPGTKPIPALQPAPDREQAVRGVIRNVSADQITVGTESGQTFTFSLEPNAPIEQLALASVAELRPGDWLNGGAIPHAQTILALLGLVVLSDPVVPPP